MGKRFAGERTRCNVIGHDLALVNNDNAVGEGSRKIEIVKNDEGPHLRRQKFAHGGQRVDLVLDVEIGDGLIEEQEFLRRCCTALQLAYHAGKMNPLLFTPRQLLKQAMLKTLEVKCCERIPDREVAIL
jgi:hypothetical protein